MESDYDKGIKFGFEMAVKLADKRMERLEKAFLTAMHWITLSQYGLSIDEFKRLEQMIHPTEPPTKGAC